MIEIKTLTYESKCNNLEIEQIAKLHVFELAHTLTSARGEEAVADLYIRLLKNRGTIVLAIEDKNVVGVLSYTIDHAKIASLITVFSKPHSWLRVIRKNGSIRTVRELIDAYNVARNVQMFDNQMLYITTLFVSSSNQNRGIASLMFEIATDESTLRKIPIVVDTRIDKFDAIGFYRGQGMQEFSRTLLSMVFFKNIEFH
jgi:ribosomal protein S18 acetylase RimI-like enzyme